MLKGPTRRTRSASSRAVTGPALVVARGGVGASPGGAPPSFGRFASSAASPSSGATAPRHGAGGESTAAVMNDAHSNGTSTGALASGAMHSTHGSRGYLRRFLCRICSAGEEQQSDRETKRQ